MKYTNKKLNIKIDNAEYFEIKELGNKVQLLTNETLMFEIYNNSTVYACENSKVDAYENLTVDAYDNSKVVAYNNSKVVAYENSTVVAYNNSKVYAYNNSTVVAYDNSKVVASQFSCIYKLSKEVTITKINHFGAIIEQVFTAYEDMLVYKKLEKNLIATLQIKKGQVFQSEKHSKCRTDSALVVSIENIDKTKTFEIGYSQHNSNFAYEVGKNVSADYDEEINECSTGIHFFLTRKEAEEY